MKRAIPVGRICGLLAALVLLLVAFGALAHRLGWWSRPASTTGDSAEVEAVRGDAAGANLVVVVLDAARADHTGCYGYPRDTTPNLDRLARSSVLFERHFTQFTRTKEATASLFTSQYADTHLAYLARPLSEKVFTMARGLAESGFDTAMFSSNFNASPALELGGDFEEVYYDPQIREVLQNGETRWSPEPCLRLLGSWLAEPRKSRFFAYLHLMPPHKPYHQPEQMTALFSGEVPPDFDPERYHPEDYDFPIEREPYEEIYPLPEWINLYDANYRYADWALGETERLLREAGVFDQTLFVVTSDHGEAFGEHGFVWHGEPIHDEVSHIPLLIRFPGGRRVGRIDALTETIDLLPTVFDLFRLPYPVEEVQGRSLLGVIAGVDERVRDYAFTRAPRHGHKYMVRGQHHALLLWGTGRWRTLYDLEADPRQTHNAIAEQPEVASAMVEVFEEFAARQRTPPLHFLDPNVPPPELAAAEHTRLPPDVKKALRNLGYVD